MERPTIFGVFIGNSENPKATTFRFLVRLCSYDEDSEILGKIRVLLTMKSNIRLSILHTICLSFCTFDIGDLTLSDAAFRFFGYFTIIDNKCTKGILVNILCILQSQKESAFFSILLLQYTLTELEIYLRKFHVVESDGEESETLLPSVTWSEEMDDFVPAKSTRVVKKDQCRLLYLKVCIKWLIPSFSLSQFIRSVRVKI